MSEPKLLDRVRNTARVRHYSRRTEEAYVMWIRRFILFHDKRHPSEMAAEEVNAFLASIALADRMSASTQNQALSAVLFLYRDVLRDPAPWLAEIARAARPARLPVVLTRDEVHAVLARMSGPAATVALLLYGSGLRLLEALQLRTSDLDFAQRQIVVRDPKGSRERRTMMPKAAIEALRQQLRTAKIVHEYDVRGGYGAVWIPQSLAVKARGAEREWAWQWLFPAPTRTKSTGEEGGSEQHRHHLHPTVVQRAIRTAVTESGIGNPVTSQTFRHTFAIHLLERGHDIRTIQQLLGHRDLSTTMIYTHILRQNEKSIASPLDAP